MRPRIALCPDCKAEGEYQGDSHEGVFFHCPECQYDWVENVNPIDEAAVVSRQVVWDCICGEQNFTDLPAEYVTCTKCGQRYSQYDIAGDDGTYEQSLDGDGNADFYAFEPDYPDDFIEPEPPDLPDFE